MAVILRSSGSKAQAGSRSSFEGKGKEEAVEKRKRPLSEEGNEAQKQQHEGVSGSRASDEAVKKKRAQGPHLGWLNLVKSDKHRAAAPVASAVPIGLNVPNMWSRAEDNLLEQTISNLIPLNDFNPMGFFAVGILVVAFLCVIRAASPLRP